MDRQTIEDNDQRLIRKFRDIVNSKEASRPATRTFKPSMGVGLTILCVTLVLAGGIILQLWPDGEKKHGEVTETRNVPVTAVQEDKIVSSVTAVEEVPEPPVETDPIVTGETESIQTQEITNTDRPDITPSSKQSDQTELHSGIHISKIVSCSRVSNRQYVAPKTIFSLKDGISPIIWMTVLADQPPVTLTHVYYVNGQQYCTVPLGIHYPRTRTWSHVTLNQSSQLGAWRVDVMTNAGEILDQIEFSVVP